MAKSNFFLIKTLNKLETGGDVLNLVKGTYKLPTTNLIPMKAFPPRPYHFYGLSYWRFWTGPLGKKKNQGHPDQKRKIKVLACRGHVLINTFKTLVVEHVGIRWQTLVADHAEILEAHVQNQCPGSGTGSPASRPVRGPSAAAGKTSLQRDHL